MKRAFWFGILAACTLLPAQAQRTTVEESGVRSKSFKVSKGGMLDVSTSVGDIRISPWGKEEVYVSVEGLDEEDLDRLKMTQSGNTVRVSFRPRWGDYGGSVRFDINVPSAFDLRLKTAGGDLTIDNGLQGKVDGSTAGGNIKLGSIKGDIEMSTSGGDITSGDFSGNGYLHTSGGDINLGKVGGTLEVSTSGGDIRGEYVAKSLEAKTSGGDIEVGDVGGETSVSTSGGDIRVGSVSGKASLSTSGGNVELKGASGVVSARTSGGDIHLVNISGSVDARTSGGEVDAELNPTGKGSSRLVSSGGKIRLYLPEQAKATVEAAIRVHGSWGRRSDRYKIKSDFTAESYDRDEDEEEIRAVYKLNGGGERIELETVNSDIEILKSRKR